MRSSAAADGSQGRRDNVDLLRSSRVLTGAVNTGPGALSIGMIVDDPAFTTE